MKLGVVVVTHGQLATELVNAAEMIVGDLPQFAAVSIGWHDDVEHAKDEIGRAIARVQTRRAARRRAGGRAGADRHVRRHAGEPGAGVPRAPQVEVITGVNLPMLIKLARPPKQADLLTLAREMREHGRNAIWVASDLLRGRDGRDLVRGRRSSTRSACTPGRRRGSFTPRAAFASRIRVARGEREMDGKSIMGLLLLAAAQGSDITISADGADEAAGARGAVRARRARIRRGGTMRLTGLGVSPGIGVGTRARPQARHARGALPAARRGSSSASSSGSTRARRGRASSSSRSRRASRTTAGAEHAYLFDAQLLMLDDPMLIERAADDHPRPSGSTPSRRCSARSSEISAFFDEAHDPYLRERKGDVADVVGRLCDEPARGRRPDRALQRPRGTAGARRRRVPPSVAAQLDWQRLAALVTDVGSWTYHTAILARSLRVPAVVGLANASDLIAPGAVVAVDGTTGEVARRPDAETLEQIEARQRRRAGARADARRVPRPAGRHRRRRRDPARRQHRAPDEAARARDAGAEGIGLFRSEFLLAGAGQAALTEEAQYRAYRRLVESAAPAAGHHPHVRRQRAAAAASSTPRSRARGRRSACAASGSAWRSTTIFQAQLRALLRAAAHGPLRVMFPFVSGARGAPRRARGRRRRHARRCATAATRVPDVPIGAMIEVPAAALTADLLAARSGLPQRRHQRSDPVHAGRRSHRRTRLAATTSRCTRRSSAPSGSSSAPDAAPGSGRGVRRDGGRSGAAGAARRPGLREFSMAPAAIPLAKRVIRGLQRRRRARRRRPRAARTDRGGGGKDNERVGRTGGVEKIVRRPQGAWACCDHVELSPERPIQQRLRPEREAKSAARERVGVGPHEH